MNARKRLVVITVTAGALGLGAAAIAVPAVAGLGPFGDPDSSATGPGWGDGPGWADGAGMANGGGMGAGPTGAGTCLADGTRSQARDGSCAAACELPAQGELTEKQQSTLAAMADEEKLAHDLYVSFAARYDAAIFDRIATAETQHLELVRTLLERYGLGDPTAGLPEGQFSEPAVQATYDQLLAKGQADLAAALEVGRTVEQTDIDDLRTALEELAAADVRQVYENLLVASQRHLAAFERWS